MRTTADNLGRALQQNLDGQATAFKRSIVRTVNRAAGMSQDKLLARFRRDFRAPVAFTTRTSGYKLTLARMTGDEPSSKFTVKQAQSDFLRFPIEGGEREVGDAGTSKKYVLKPTKYAKLTASGSLQRYYTRELVKSSGKTVAVRGGGGYFFGNVGGHDDEGFIKRPLRTRVHLKFGRKGKLVLARPNDHLRVSNIGRPVMLVRADDKSKHNSIVDYDGVMNEGFDEAMDGLQRRLDEELAR